MKKGEDVTAFLGKGTEWEGRLSFHKTTRIDGHLKGEISSEGTLLVGEEAMIEATIHTSRIVIYGEIHGYVSWNGVLESPPFVKAQARAHGTHSPRLNSLPANPIEVIKTIAAETNRQ